MQSRATKFHKFTRSCARIVNVALICNEDDSVLRKHVI